MSNKISTNPYKGVRDFYPEDMFIQNYIFDIWKEVAESFGYCQYEASILEPAELYKAKSGEEIVNEQTYIFFDRGEREVALRPEMTPTIARMISAKEKELSFPLRWYSIPNLFRYEKPQRGRMREHWQLNVDFFGVDSTDADVEIISVADKIMKRFGAQISDYSIKINSRKLLNDFYKYFSLTEDQSYKLAKIIDKKNKIPDDVFRDSMSEILGEKTEEVLRLLSSPERFVDTVGKNSKGAEDVLSVIEKLEGLDIRNVVFDPTLMRGFDYYTGIVFEVFDNHPENNRSIFGGGRYDDLLDIFGGRKIPATGFGTGDVTVRDFLEIHNLLPDYLPPTELYICTISEEYIPNAIALADAIREEGIKVSVNMTDKKVGDQIKTADKQKIPFVVIVGEDEIKSDTYSIKNLETGEETRSNIAGLVERIKGTRAVQY